MGHLPPFLADSGYAFSPAHGLAIQNRGADSVLVVNVTAKMGQKKSYEKSKGHLDLSKLRSKAQRMLG